MASNGSSADFLSLDLDVGGLQRGLGLLELLPREQRVLQLQLPGVHADRAAEVGDRRHPGVKLQQIQELQRAFQLQGGPGGQVDDGVGVAGGFDAGK
jgi:hypothetical protein